MFKGKRKGREINWRAFGPQRMGCRLVVGTIIRCKHIIGLAIGVKLANPPPEAKKNTYRSEKKKGAPFKIQTSADYSVIVIFNNKY